MLLATFTYNPRASTTTQHIQHNKKPEICKELSTRREESGVMTTINDTTKPSWTLAPSRFIFSASLNSLALLSLFPMIFFMMFIFCVLELHKSKLCRKYWHKRQEGWRESWVFWKVVNLRWRRARTNVMLTALAQPIGFVREMSHYHDHQIFH